MPHARQLELIVDDARFSESPRWHDGALWFSDIGAGKVWRVAPDGSRREIVSTIAGPSGLGWTRDGDLLVAALVDSTVYRVAPDGAVSAVCGPAEHGTGGTNDMATAGSRSYVTCAGRTHREGDSLEGINDPIGSIIMIEHETCAVRTVASGYAMPNGIAFTPDGKGLVFSELFGSRLIRFDVEADGSLSNERLFAALEGCADGICMDAQGAVWSATTSMDSGRSRCERIDADGAVVDEIAMPDWPAIACALGGEGGRDLFIVANRIETPDDVFNGKARSRIYRTRVNVPAAPPL